MNTKITPQPSLNDMLKAAMAGTIGKLDVTAEAMRQLGEPETKTASATTDSLPTDLLAKLADACEYIADELDKEAAVALSAPAAGQPAPGTGPGALHVMKNEAVAGKNPAQPNQSGGKPGPATATEKGHAHAPDNAMATNKAMHHPEQPADPVNGKTASLAESNFARIMKLAGFDKEALLPMPDMGKVHAALGAAKKALPGGPAGGIVAQMAQKAQAPMGIAAQFAKRAEDANNPAQISAGPAVAPDTSASEEGVPATPADVSAQERLINTNRAAIDYTKRDAKRDPVSDVAKLVTHTPMQDPVLGQVFAHSGQAGVKTSSALDATKVAAARTLLSRLVKEANDKNKKTKESNMGAGQAGAPPPPGVPSPAFTQ